MPLRPTCKWREALWSNPEYSWVCCPLSLCNCQPEDSQGKEMCARGGISSTSHNSVCAWWGPDGDLPWTVTFLTTVTKYLAKDLKEGRVFFFSFFELTVLGGHSLSWGKHSSKSRSWLVTWHQQSGSRESSACWGSAHFLLSHFSTVHGLM